MRTGCVIINVKLYSLQKQILQHVIITLKLRARPFVRNVENNISYSESNSLFKRVI